MTMTSLRYALFCGLGLMVAACTITTGPGDDRDPRPWGPGGSGGEGDGGDGGSGGGDGGDGGSGGSGGQDPGTGGSGGAGGQDPGDDGQCIESPTAGDCEKCAFIECEAHVCDCKADPDCSAALNELDFFACLEAADGDPTEVANCDIAFIQVTETEAGADLANELGMCVHGNLEDESIAGCPLECGT